MSHFLSGIALLVVDDDEDALDLMVVLLTAQGAGVHAALDAASAMAALEGWTPHVVLLDIAMPREDGYSLLGRIRSRCETQDVRAIAVTAGATARDRDRARAAGFDRYVTKPVDLEELVSAVAEVCGAGEPTASGVRCVAPPDTERGTG